MSLDSAHAALVPHLLIAGRGLVFRNQFDSTPPPVVWKMFTAMVFLENLLNIANGWEVLQMVQIACITWIGVRPTVLDENNFNEMPTLSCQWPAYVSILFWGNCTSAIGRGCI